MCVCVYVCARFVCLYCFLPFGNKECYKILLASVIWRPSMINARIEPAYFSNVFYSVDITMNFQRR